MEKTVSGISLGEAMITVLDFADNFVIFAETLEVLVGVLDILSTESKPLSVNFSWIKTKIHRFVTFIDENIDILPPTAVHGERVSFVDNIMYLGRAIGSGGRSFPEINR